MSEYEELLKNAPTQDSLEFIDYLRDNNVVVLETPEWIVIENFKYHTLERSWYTAFWKGHAVCGTACQDWWSDLDELWYHEDWVDWEWRKHPLEKQIMPGRFHIHLIKHYP